MDCGGMTNVSDCGTVGLCDFTTLRLYDYTNECHLAL